MAKRRLAMHKRPIGNQSLRDWYQQTPKWKLLEIAVDLALGGTGFDETESLENVLNELQHRGHLLTSQRAYRITWSS